MSELATMLRTHYDGVESGDLDLAVSVFHPDLECETPNGPMHGIAEFRAFGEVFHAAAPDGRMEVRHSYETGDTIIVEGDFVGPHRPADDPGRHDPGDGAGLRAALRRRTAGPRRPVRRPPHLLGQRGVPGPARTRAAAQRVLNRRRPAAGAWR